MLKLKGQYKTDLLKICNKKYLLYYKNALIQFNIALLLKIIIPYSVSFLSNMSELEICVANSIIKQWIDLNVFKSKLSRGIQK